ncbi:hypothetical protein FHG87_019003, partial [Trinorchestia longiramus]
MNVMAWNGGDFQKLE